MRRAFFTAGDRLSKELVENMEKMEARSRDHSLLLVNVCLDYSGKWDIAQSCMKIMHQAPHGFDPG